MGLLIHLLSVVFGIQQITRIRDANSLTLLPFLVLLFLWNLIGSLLILLQGYPLLFYQNISLFWGIAGIMAFTIGLKRSNTGIKASLLVGGGMTSVYFLTYYFWPELFPENYRSYLLILFFLPVLLVVLSQCSSKRALEHEDLGAAVLFGVNAAYILLDSIIWAIF